MESDSAHDEESGRSDDDSSTEGASDNDDNMEEEQEEGGLARSAEELISKLENDEWEEELMWLESAMLTHLLQHVERFREALQGNTVITEVCIHVVRLFTFQAPAALSPEDFTILGQVFASLESLQSLTLTTWASPTGFENLSHAVAFVRQTRQIQHFSLEVLRRDMGTEHRLDTRGYADALSHLQTLDSIELRGLSPEEGRHITLAFPSLNLKSVTFDSYDFTSDDEGLQEVLRLATLRNLPLTKCVLSERNVLTIGEHRSYSGSRLARLEFDSYDFTSDDDCLQQVLRLATLRDLSLTECILSERNVLTIGEHLSYSGSRLTSLALDKCQLPRKGCESLSASLKCNDTLQDLDLSSHVPADTFFHTLKDSLSVNKSLAFLTVTGDLSKKAAIDLVETIRGNYSLVNVHLMPDSSSNRLDVNQKSMLRCFPRLNLVGRRYMIEESPSSEKGFDVLWHVKEDLDCLFLHLQENPWLCTEVMRRAVDEEGKAGAIGQEDDEKPPASKKRRSI